MGVKQQYLPVALASRLWKDSWCNMAKETRALTRGISPARLREYFKQENNPLTPSHRISTTLAGRGDLGLLRVAVAFNCGWMDDQACPKAAEQGHLPCLQFLRANGFPWKVLTLENAAFGGHIHVLNWAWENNCPRGNGIEAISCRAARGGHQHVIEWARDHNCLFSVWTFHFAAAGGNLDILKDLRANGCRFNELSCMAAAEHGHVDALKWLRQEGCP